jgi:hypothetical protein
MKDGQRKEKGELNWKKEKMTRKKGKESRAEQSREE